ncbi:MAG: metallophosphoesterase [Clostridia bacterium]|nr:metallophosphoesterase [Clostridia bacterium]
MKIRKTVILSLLAIVLSLALVTPVIFAEGEKGMTFTASDLYRTTLPVNEAPRTFEAVIKVSKTAGDGRLGIMAGNYGVNDKAFTAINFEIRDKGKPSVYWQLAGASSVRVDFNTDIRTGEVMHLAITVSETEAKCYVDGVLVDTKTGSFKNPEKSTLANMALGGDYRSGNAQNLKSAELYSVSLFSDVRDEAAVKADMDGVDFSDSKLVGSYDLTREGIERLRDLSNNENHLAYTNSGDSSKNESFLVDTMKEGTDFSSNRLYRLANIPEKTPYTFEAEIYFPAFTPKSDRGGVIFGNYEGPEKCINFEIYSNGNPRLFWTNKNGTIIQSTFGNVNVYTGEWIHLAIVLDKDAGKAHCYVNGELAQTVKFAGTEGSPCPTTYVVGGDLRGGNGQSFKGRMKSLAVYEDLRTADEIKSDVTTLDKSGLICAYKFDSVSDGNYPDSYTDISDNKNDAKLKKYFIDGVESDFEYSYSFAVIGDTQIVAKKHPTEFPKIYDYILDNLDEKKINMVMGLGDITDANSSAEWALAKENITRLNGKVRYSLVRGNHDGLENFRSTFLKTGYTDQLGGVYKTGQFENSWQELVVGDIKYLIMTLDYGANDRVLEWAAGVIEKHPYHNVIITTHCYLYRDGTTLDKGDVCPPTTSGGYNNGDHMWDKLVSKHENIVLVLSGHDPCDQIIMTKTEGEKGNTVTQMLIDPQGVDAAQGATGMVAMFYFSEDGSKLRVEYYSTVKEQYLMPENQFETEINVIREKTEPAPSVTTTVQTTTAPTPVTGNPSVTTPAPGTTADQGGNDVAPMEIVTPIIIGAVILVAAGAVAVIIIKKKK